MDNTVEVGNEAALQPSQQAIESPASHRLTKARPGLCGAMAQQGGDFGRSNQSAPQKLLQLVGYRDPKASMDPRKDPRNDLWVRPLPVPAKR